MSISPFPPVEDADSSGVIAVGGSLSLDLLLRAYCSGIFPWPIDDGTLAWFAPPQRAILFLNEIHFSKSFFKFLKKTNLRVSFNTSFKEVVKLCASTRANHTWITTEIIDSYFDLFSHGCAISVEVFDEDELVGGLYGVLIDKFFAGESMFHLVDNASKVAVFYLKNFLHEKNISWIDCQVMTPFFKSLGSREIKRNEFQQMLSESISNTTISSLLRSF
jgi:leucyl/phenylalanyl-tRNA---protein transferase